MREANVYAYAPEITSSEWKLQLVARVQVLLISYAGFSTTAFRYFRVDQGEEVADTTIMLSMDYEFEGAYSNLMQYYTRLRTIVDHSTDILTILTLTVLDCLMRGRADRRLKQELDVCVYSRIIQMEEDAQIQYKIASGKACPMVGDDKGVWIVPLNDRNRVSEAIVGFMGS
jgi:hypothetical protein